MKSIENELIEEHYTKSPKETEKLGRFIAKKTPNLKIIAFMGDLGAGKTTFIKGFINEINKIKEDAILSPTFTYLNIYEGEVPIYHFDLYRIKDKEEFLNMGFDEYFYEDGICIIEWSERITSILPKDTLIIHILNQKLENERKISLLRL